MEREKDIVAMSRAELEEEVARLRQRVGECESALLRVHRERTETPWTGEADAHEIGVDCPYREALENLSAIVVFINASGIIRYANPHARRAFGFGPYDPLGMDGREILVPTTTNGRDQTAIVDELLSHPEEHRHDTTQLRRADGELIWVSWSRQPVYDARGVLLGVLSVGNDVTLEKQAERLLIDYQSNLRSLASESALAEASERRRIAARIHEEICQNLAYAKLCVGKLRECPRLEACREDVDEVDSFLEDAIAGTRALASELSPPMLYDLGLAAAVEWLVEVTSDRHAIDLEFEDDGLDKALDGDLRVLLFQAVRELLDNVIEHSEARRAAISLGRENDHIRVVVEDDGVGFDPSALHTRSADGTGFGLFDIRERLTHMGGTVEVEADPIHGTRVVLRAPLSN